MTESFWLTIILFLPLAGGLMVFFVHRRALLVRWLALSFSLLVLALLAGTAFTLSSASSDGIRSMIENRPWIESLGIHYHLALDGISLALCLLTAFLIPMTILVSWNQVRTRSAAFHFLLLLTETSVFGLFMARDLFLFYFFWEIQIIPLFILIGVWGHENRVRAAVKFLLYTAGTGLVMLFTLIALYLLHGGQTGQYTFSLDQLMAHRLPAGDQMWLFAAFFLALGVKIPVVPLHMWLPDAHTQAPTAGSVILAGILLKTGVYALLTIAIPLFPDAASAAAPLLLALGVIGLFYAAWIAFSQTDIKRLVAFSSIAHMGLIVLGLAVWTDLTLHGALIQMINHGLSTSALFIMIGMLGERVESRQISDLGGLWKKMPVFAAFFLLFGMSSMGLPGLNNFVGEILILVGTLPHHPLAAVLGFCGMVLTLLYILKLMQGVLFGPVRTDLQVWDVTSRELLILGTLAAAVILIGLYPSPVLDYFDAPAGRLLDHTVGLMGR